jgi:hypothetical protein
MPDEAEGNDHETKLPKLEGELSPGTAESVAAIFSDLLKHLEGLQGSVQRASTAVVAYMDRIILLAGGTLTLIFTVLGSVSAHLYEIHQQARHVPYVLISCWLLVATIVAGLIYNRVTINLGQYRDTEQTLMRADSQLRLALLKMRGVTDTSSIPPLMGATNLQLKIKSATRLSTVFGLIAQWALTAAFIFLVIFIQSNISVMLAAAPHK